jgi:Spy/CpxP family protein refolding chaperone
MTIRIFTAAFIGLFTVSVLGHQQTSQSTARPSTDQKQQPAGATDSRPSSHTSFRWWTNEKYRKELKLTPEQSAQIDKIYQTMIERIRQQKEDFDRAQAEFSQLMKKGVATERELLRSADTLELARFKVSSERTSMLVKIHSVLTAEQRLGLQAIVKRDRDNDDRNRSR